MSVQKIKASKSKEVKLGLRSVVLPILDTLGNSKSNVQWNFL